MNKLILPIVFIAIIAITAGFAFAPADQASTVDEEITDTLSDNICIVRNGPGSTWDGESCQGLDE